MIIALAGRRIDAPDAEKSRFPLANAPLVRRKIEGLFRTRTPAGIVCSAACGADLIALEVASQLNIPSRIVLPFDPEEFRITSVIDRPGDWGNIYDTLIAAHPHIIIVGDNVADEEVYLKTNQQILDQAEKFDNSMPQGAPKGRTTETVAHAVLAVVVWDGNSRGNSDVTQHFAMSARERGFEVVEIRTC